MRPARGRAETVSELVVPWDARVSKPNGASVRDGGVFGGLGGWRAGSGARERAAAAVFAGVFFLWEGGGGEGGREGEFAGDAGDCGGVGGEGVYG